MLSALKKYLLVPKLVKLSSAAPKDPREAWDQFWGSVRATGPRGDVLWDSGDDHEMLGYVEQLKRQLNPDLPIVDVGCGNGTFSRRLAAHFPHVLGVDVSPASHRPGARRIRGPGAGVVPGGRHDRPRGSAHGERRPWPPPAWPGKRTSSSAASCTC